MGCGTSIPAIFASMRGACSVTVIDIGDWYVNNSKDHHSSHKIDINLLEDKRTEYLSLLSFCFSVRKLEPGKTGINIHKNPPSGVTK